MSDTELLNSAGNKRGMHLMNVSGSEDEKSDFSKKGNDARVAKRTAEAMSELKEMGSNPLSPQSIQNLRRRVMHAVEANLERAEEVLSGERHWTATQARIFGMLLNKVVPDLHHSQSTVSVEHKNINELSIEELKVIAARGVAKVKQPDVIDVEVKNEPETATNEQ